MDAIQWLNDSGGSWSVGATPTICLVIVAVGAIEVAVPAGQLRAEQVHAALVAAVERVRAALGEAGLIHGPKPARAAFAVPAAYGEEES